MNRRREARAARSHRGVIPVMARWVAGILSAGLVLLGSSAAFGQTYPNRPIRIVTTQPGSTSEFAGRVIAEKLAGVLVHQVIIENRGIVGPEIVANSPPDGYNLLLYTSPLWLMPLFRRNVPWDALRDFAPITSTVSTPTIVVVHPSVPVKSIRELIALAKARPGELNYGSSSTGSVNHVAAELFKSMAGVSLARVNYKGAGAALNDLMGGQVQVMFATAGTVTGHIKSARLRALAVTTAQPSELAPGLPTVAASGLPGYESSSLSGVFAPAGTEAVVITKLNQEIVRVLHRPDVKELLFKSGVEVMGSSPEDFTATIKAEIARMSKVIQDAGLRE